jgi:hypothetical protein
MNSTIISRVEQIRDEIGILKLNNETDHLKIINLISSAKSNYQRVLWALFGVGGLTISLLGWFIYHIGGGN